MIGDGLDLAEHAIHPLRQTVGDLHVAQRAAFDGRTLGRAHQQPVLVELAFDRLASATFTPAATKSQ